MTMLVPHFVHMHVNITPKMLELTQDGATKADAIGQGSYRGRGCTPYDSGGGGEKGHHLSMKNLVCPHMM